MECESGVGHVDYAIGPDEAALTVDFSLSFFMRAEPRRLSPWPFLPNRKEKAPTCPSSPTYERGRGETHRVLQVSLHLASSSTPASRRQGLLAGDLCWKLCPEIQLVRNTFRELL